MDFNKWNPFWTACFGVMAFLIVVGNSLTIATLLKKKFRKGPHSLLISLAVADLLVGCTIPLYVAGMIMMSRKPEILSFTVHASTFFIVSSMLHLPVISLERVHATLRPFRHRQLTWKVYWVAISTPWILTVFLTISAFVLGRFVGSLGAVFFIIAFVTTPLLVTCFSYFVIWKKTRQSRDKVRSFRQNQEARFSRTIFTVTAASVVTWMPFQLCGFVISLSPTTFIPLLAVFFTVLTQFSNSLVNFAIYFFRFPNYRKSLLSSVNISCSRRATKP